MTDELNMRDQIGKFIEAINILAINDLADLNKLGPRVNAATYLLQAGRILGVIEGRVRNEYEQHSNGITKRGLSKMMSDIQRSARLASGDGITDNKLRGFLARMTEYVDTAFDIAFENKPLPELSDNVATGPSKRF